MKLLHLFLSFLAISIITLFAACEKDPMTPSKIRITNIKVTEFPATESNGAGWDLTSGPDIYVKITYNNSDLYSHPDDFQNANPAQSYDFVPNINLNLDDPSDIYILQLMDRDDFDADDIMASLSFIPYQGDDKFPETLSFDSGNGFAFELTVVYTF